MDMRNKILILILVASVFAIQFANAVPAAPSPTCEIIANVLNVEKTRTNILGQSSRQNYYSLNLDILNISIHKQEGDFSCDNSYIDSAEKSGQILILDEYNKNPISEGQKIKAKIHLGGDERFNGYFLSDIQILEGATTENDKTKWLKSLRFIIPTLIILFIILHILLKRKRK